MSDALSDLPKDVRELCAQIMGRGPALLRMAFMTGGAGKSVQFTVTDSAQPGCFSMRVSVFLEFGESFSFRMIAVCAATGEPICRSVWGDLAELEPGSWSMEYAVMQDPEGRQLPLACVGGPAG